MKRRRTQVAMPYQLPGGARHQFGKIQAELGGLRGKPEPMIWKAASLAELQHEHSRGRLGPEDQATMARYRAELGLAPA